MVKKTSTDSKSESGYGFSGLLRRLVRVPKEELLAEERKYDAAKRRRQQKAKKKR